MIIFLFVYLMVYGGMHAYVYSKARAAFVMEPKMVVLVLGFMALMILSPILARLFESRGQELLARGIGIVGFMWFGMIFLFLTIGVTLDLYSLAVKLLGANVSLLVPGPTRLFYVVLGLTLLVYSYGYYEAETPRVERVSIKTSKLKPGMKPIRLLQISDVHLGLIASERRIKRVVEIIKKENPDLIVSTGDLVDGQIDGMDHFEKYLSDMKPRLGKFAVTGNHEFYAGLPDAEAFTRSSGFELLAGKSALLEDGALAIAGIDDPEVIRNFGVRGLPEAELLSSLPESAYRVLLKHQPRIGKSSVGMFDLQLSGHTHKGQIFPFMLIVKLPFKYLSGRYNLSGGSTIYVSRGTGTWGPPIRVLSPPEITVFEISPQGS